MTGGDADRAARLTSEAEALIGQIANPYWQVEALIRLAETVAATGYHDRAARLTGEAAALAGQITNPYLRAEVLARLAAVVVEASKETSPVPEHAPGSSPLMVRARQLLVAALVTGSWTKIVSSLARVDPLAVNALADELLVRWGLNSPCAPRDGQER